MRAMHRPARVLAVLALLAGALACTAPKSKICRDTCTREADCHESGPSEDTTFDEGECIAACAALERDPETRGLVTIHAECVKNAEGCRGVLECK
jgi:hypothetical protein